MLKEQEAHEARRSYIVEENGIVTYASDFFYETTKFHFHEIVGKSTEFILHDLLRIHGNQLYDGEKTETYLFTKHLEARKISFQRLVRESGAFCYYIEEVPGWRMEQNSQYVKRLLLDNVKGVGFFTVPDFMLYETNQHFLDHLPNPFNSKDAVYGRMISEFFPGFDGSEEEEAWMEAAAKNHTCYVREKKSVLGGDEICFLDYTLTPIEKSGQVESIILVMEDVTERVLNKRRVAAQASMIRQQNELLEAVIENLNDVIIIYDGQGRVLLSNAESRRVYPHVYLDVPVDEVHTGYECFDSENQEIPRENLPAFRVLKGERIKNMVMKVKSKEKVSIVEANAVPVYNSDNQLIAAIISHHDITQMKEFEEKLYQHKELLEIILDNSYDNISVVDRHGNYIYNKNNIVKEAAEKFTDVNEVFRAVEYYDIDGNEIPLERMVVNRVKNGERIKDELVVVKVSGEEYYLLYSGTPIYDDKGNFLYGIGYSRNFSEIVKSQNALKDAQEKLLKSEQEKNDVLTESLNLKDEFLYLITHEFRTPLTVIKSAIQTMELKYRDMPDKAVRYLKTIKQNVNRQIRLVNNLLDITRISSGNIKLNNGNYDIVFLTKSIVESIQSIAQQKKIKVTFSTELKRKVICFDEEKFERILLNLLSNSIKFTRPGKTIQVVLYAKKLGNKRMVCIGVQDEGIGIPKEKQSCIFERFGQVNNCESREAEGTGIGLHLVKLFVTVMGGDISLESEEGVGSTFTVMFPEIKPMNGPSAMEKTSSIESVNKLIQMEAIELSDIYL